MRHAKPFSPEHPRILDTVVTRTDWTPFDCLHLTFVWNQRVHIITGHPPSRRYFCSDCKTSLGRHEEVINDT